MRCTHIRWRLQRWCPMHRRHTGGSLAVHRWGSERVDGCNRRGADRVCNVPRILGMRRWVVRDELKARILQPAIWAEAHASRKERSTSLTSSRHRSIPPSSSEKVLHFNNYGLSVGFYCVVKLCLSIKGYSTIIRR